MPSQLLESQHFWDNLFQREQGIVVHDMCKESLKSAAEWFGSLSGKLLLDVGCGLGASSLFFASLGASVISVDQSDVAIRKLNEYCASNGIGNIQAIRLDAMDIAQLEPVDFVFGSMVLHHLEPFEQFAKSLRATLKSGGRCFFFENSSNSSALIWVRTHLTGKFGIPKYGDADEFPLEPREVDILRKYFDTRQEIPYLYLFRLAAEYIGRNRFKAAGGWLDRQAYKAPGLRSLSYHQYLYLS